jgi:L-histidine N-alpha-methyltransferase
MTQFRDEVITGLSGQVKSLSSKWFYDAEGDVLFQQIMNSPEYYLTRCELDIFKEHTADIAAAIEADKTPLDLIELGAGDGSKTIHLLKHLAEKNTAFQYLPIDISPNILQELQSTIRSSLPELSIVPFNGEYLPMLAAAVTHSERRKVVLFLGANIGNVLLADAANFCSQIRSQLQPGDIAFIGFDLMKNPRIIRAAYDDAEGITSAFNLNLLKRINRELDGNFKVDLFEHYCNYDPQTGSCKSYLVSLATQDVMIGESIISFKEGEVIWVEISQKYSLDKIKEIAINSGFEMMTYITDKRGWFADVVWKAI